MHIFRCTTLCLPCKVPTQDLTTVSNVDMGQISTLVNDNPLASVINLANNTLDGAEINDGELSGSFEFPEPIFAV